MVSLYYSLHPIRGQQHGLTPHLPQRHRQSSTANNDNLPIRPILCLFYSPQRGTFSILQRHINPPHRYWRLCVSSIRWLSLRSSRLRRGKPQIIWQSCPLIFAVLWRRCLRWYHKHGSFSAHRTCSYKATDPATRSWATIQWPIRLHAQVIST